MITWVSLALSVALVASCQPEPKAPPAPPVVQPPPVEDPLLVGRALLRQKRYADARAAYEQARKRHPQSGEVLATLGRIHLALGQPDEATQFYEMAVALEADQPEWLVALGNVHLKLNRYDQAHSAFAAALALDSTYAPARRNKAAVYSKQGRLGDAEIGRAHV